MFSTPGNNGLRAASIACCVFRDVIESNLVSKTDLEAAKVDLVKMLEITKADLEKMIERTRADIIKWVAGMLVAQAAIVATLVKLL